MCDERSWNNIYQGSVHRFVLDFSFLAVSNKLLEICNWLITNVTTMLPVMWCHALKDHRCITKNVQQNPLCLIVVMNKINLFSCYIFLYTCFQN